MPETLPTALALLIALIGGAGGIAALMKVNADNSKVVSEGATNVVKMLRDQISDLDDRLGALEEYAGASEEWSDRVITLLERAIKVLPEAIQESFRAELEGLERTRPVRRRGAAK